MTFLKVLNCYRNLLGLLFFPAILSPIFTAFNLEIAGILYTYCLMVFYWLLKILPNPIVGVIPFMLLPFFKVSSSVNTALGYLHEPNMIYLGGAILSGTIQVNNLKNRIALHIIYINNGSPRRIHAFIMFISFLASLIISPIIVIIILCPIIESILKFLELHGSGKYFANELVTYELVYAKSQTNLRRQSIVQNILPFTLNVEKRTQWFSDQISFVYRINSDQITRRSFLPTDIRQTSSHDLAAALPSDKMIVLDDDEVNAIIKGLKKSNIQIEKEKDVQELDNKLNKSSRVLARDYSSEILSDDVISIFDTSREVEEKNISETSSEYSIPPRLFNLDENLENKKLSEHNLKDENLEEVKKKTIFSINLSLLFSDASEESKRITRIMVLPHGFNDPSNLTTSFFIGAAYACTLGGYCNVILPDKFRKKLSGRLKDNFQHEKITLSPLKWCILFYPVSILMVIAIYIWLETLFMGFFRPKSKDYQIVNSYKGSRIKENVKDMLNEMGGITYLEGAVIVTFSSCFLFFIFYNPLNFPGWGIIINYSIYESTILLGVLFCLFTIPDKTSFLESFNFNNLEKLSLKRQSGALLTWSKLHYTVYMGFIFANGGVGTMFHLIRQKKILEKLLTKLFSVLPDSKLKHMLVTFVITSLLTELSDSYYMVENVTNFFTLWSIDKKWDPLLLTLIAENAASHEFCTTLGSIPNLIIGFWCNIRYIDLLIAGLGAHFSAMVLFFGFYFSFSGILFNVHIFSNWSDQRKSDNFTIPGII